MNTITQNPKATTLQTQILCINSLYQHSKEIIQTEVSFLTQFIGKDILKVDGSFKAKYQHEGKTYNYKVNAFNFDFWVNTHYYFSADYGKLSINVITTVSGGGYDKNGVNCNHSQQKQSFDLFNISKYGILSDICNEDRQYLDIIFDESEILANAEKVKEAAKRYESVLSTVPYLFIDTLYLQRLR